MVSPDLACSRPISPRYELLCEIRKIRNSVSVIMISAYESIDLVERCILSGADAYLLKPLRMHELRNIWQYVWRRRHEAVLQQHVSEELMSARRAAERKEPALEKATKLRGERQRLYTTDYPELALAARQLDRLAQFGTHRPLGLLR